MLSLNTFIRLFLLVAFSFFSLLCLINSEAIVLLDLNIAIFNIDVSVSIVYLQVICTCPDTLDGGFGLSKRAHRINWMIVEVGR